MNFTSEARDLTGYERTTCTQVVWSTFDFGFVSLFEVRIMCLDGFSSSNHAFY